MMRHVHTCLVSSLIQDNFTIKYYMYTTIIVYVTAAAEKLFCYVVLNKIFKGPVSPSKPCSHLFFIQAMSKLNSNVKKNDDIMTKKFFFWTEKKKF